MAKLLTVVDYRHLMYKYLSNLEGSHNVQTYIFNYNNVLQYLIFPFIL